MRKRPPPPAQAGERRRVTLVTAMWADPGEAPYALRLIAGALAAEARVTVVHAVPSLPGPAVVQDGAFEVRRVLATSPEPAAQEAVLAAVGGADRGRPLPAMLGHGLLELEGGWAEAVLQTVSATEPDVVVLGGSRQAWPSVALEALASRSWRRVAVPLADDDPKLELPGYRDVLGVADTVATLTPTERRRVEAALAAASPPESPSLVDLAVPVPVNPSARQQHLHGLTGFEGYVLALRGFPPGGPGRAEVPDYERMRALAPGLDVADVSESGWRASRGGGRLKEIASVGHSRVNLWRLMAHALVTVDLRPGGLFGREAIESLLVGTPAIVLAGHPATDLLEESGGGLVLGDEADLPEAVASLAAGDRRQAMSERGEAWARERHSDHQRFARAVVQALL